MEQNERADCKYYDGCSAPFCPMLNDEQNMSYIWYPDEEICRKVKGVPAWVRKQRKIAKQCNPDHYWFYFTLDMLKVNFRVTKQVKGIDPNIGEDLQLKQWFNNHKEIKERKVPEETRMIDLAKAAG